MITLCNQIESANVIRKTRLRNCRLNTAASLVQPLFEGPIDIVGDIHGEIDALHDLLGQLGYADDGSHTEGRRLVFVGDLADRGPDSPAVIDVVKRLIQAEHAQCVLGNHELNILRGDRKHDNHWFFGEEWSLDGSNAITPAVLADESIRSSVTAFFETLPLALEREDLRVVHACWDQAMIEIARSAADACSLYSRCKNQIDADHNARQKMDAIERGIEHQNRNAVKVLTSGVERRVTTPFQSSGKLRFQERVPWWEGYGDDQPFCVFGHYSLPKDKRRSSPQSHCVDYGVAKRWLERATPGFDGSYQLRLAAVRFPERIVIFDDGSSDQVENEQ